MSTLLKRSVATSSSKLVEKFAACVKGSEVRFSNPCVKNANKRPVVVSIVGNEQVNLNISDDLKDIVRNAMLKYPLDAVIGALADFPVSVNKDGVYWVNTENVANPATTFEAAVKKASDLGIKLTIAALETQATL